MTGMEHAIEQAARIIDPDGWRLRDSGTLPLDHPGAQAVVRRSLETARALSDAGLLAPRTAHRSPSREPVRGDAPPLGHRLGTRRHRGAEPRG